MAETLANESGPYGHPTEGDGEKYTALANQIVGQFDLQWAVPNPYGLVLTFGTFNHDCLANEAKTRP